MNAKVLIASKDIRIWSKISLELLFSQIKKGYQKMHLMKTPSIQKNAQYDKRQDLHKYRNVRRCILLRRVTTHSIIKQNSTTLLHPKLYLTLSNLFVILSWRHVMTSSVLLFDVTAPRSLFIAFFIPNF